MFSNSIWNLARGAAMVVALGASLVGAARADEPASRFVPAIDSIAPKAGESFTLWWLDESLPLDGPTAFTTGDVWVAYDASVLTLTDFSAGSIFNGAAAMPNNGADLPDQYPWLAVYSLTLAPFVINDGFADGALSQQDVVMVTFVVNPLAPTGTTNVYFLPDQIAVQGGFGDLPEYYAFGSTDGYGAGISITAIPEPASLALMLAGLGVVAGAAVRRQKATASAA